MDESHKMSAMHVQETYGVTNCNFYKIVKSDSAACLTRIQNTEKWPSLTSFFMGVFLPHGYPDSVSKDYLQYQIWDSIQAFASSITGNICTHAVLKGAGVGDETASPLAATITWLIKDGTSMVGRIVFAWLQGTKLDCECKKWRLFADVINDLAMLLDLLSAYFHKNFMLIICTSGLLKSLVGVAGGCTRAALTQHQARRNNMADVSAKDGSQETLVNLIALICSLVIVPVVVKSLMLTWIIFVSMTILHLTANYLAVRSVVMETFNIGRFKIFADLYFSKGSMNRHVMSVEEVNRRESVFFSIQREKYVIKLGCSFKDLCGSRSCNEIRKILQLYTDAGYILCLSKINSSRVIIKIALTSKASFLTMMEGMYQACFIIHLLKSQHIGLQYLENENTRWYYESSSRDYTKKSFSDFIKNIRTNGFNINNTFFETDMWRVNWN